MALRLIRKKGDDILSKKCKIVKEITPSILTLIDDMYDTMKEASGVGIAAPQVGVLKRIVVIDMDDKKIELINPVIVEISGEQTNLEGCLSIPGEHGYVTRPFYVKVEALNRHGEPIVVEGEENLAVCLAHEIDHLDGRLYTEHATYKEFHERDEDDDEE